MGTLGTDYLCNGKIVALMSCDGDFKIRSKKDAQAFFDMKKDGPVNATDGEFYWNTTTTDYYLSVNGNTRNVYSRPMFARGDIFFPYCQVTDPVEAIWKTRKYINRKWFNREAY